MANECLTGPLPAELETWSVLHDGDVEWICLSLPNRWNVGVPTLSTSELLSVLEPPVHGFEAKLLAELRNKLYEYKHLELLCLMLMSFASDI